MPTTIILFLYKQYSPHAMIICIFKGTTTRGSFFSILSTGHLHFKYPVFFLCCAVIKRNKPSKIIIQIMTSFPQRLQLKGINTHHDIEGKRGLSFLSKGQKLFSWSFNLFLFLVCICTKELDYPFKQTISSSKSRNSVCQENKNILFTKFTDTSFPKHTW